MSSTLKDTSVIMTLRWMGYDVDTNIQAVSCPELMEDLADEDIIIYVPISDSVGLFARTVNDLVTQYQTVNCTNSYHKTLFDHKHCVVGGFQGASKHGFDEILSEVGYNLGTIVNLNNWCDPDFTKLEHWSNMTTGHAWVVAVARGKEIVGAVSSDRYFEVFNHDPNNIANRRSFVSDDVQPQIADTSKPNTNPAWQIRNDQISETMAEVNKLLLYINRVDGIGSNIIVKTGTNAINDNDVCNDVALCVMETLVNKLSKAFEKLADFGIPYTEHDELWCDSQGRRHTLYTLKTFTVWYATHRARREEPDYFTQQRDQPNA